MRKFLVILFLPLLFACEDDDPSIYSNNDNEYFPDDSIMNVEVTFVYDGDTFAFYENSVQYKVRVLKIDCFETSKNSRLSDQAEKAGITVDSALTLGIKAREFANSVLNGNEVTLIRDKYAPNTDDYDRLLRIVEINGERYDSLLTDNHLTVN